MTTLGLAHLPGRCPTCAFHIATQGCRCPGGEWAIFTAAIRSAAREDLARYRRLLLETPPTA